LALIITTEHKKKIFWSGARKRYEHAALRGKSVLVKGTKNGTTTDFDHEIITLAESQHDAIIESLILGITTLEITLEKFKTTKCLPEINANKMDEVGFTAPEHPKRIKKSTWVFHSAQVIV